MKTLLAAYDRLIGALVALAAALAGGVCLLIAWDVIARNIGLRPPDSTVALTEYALLYITLACAPALVRSRGHVIVSLALEHLPAGLRRAWERGILLLCATLAAVVAVLATALAVEAVQRGEVDVRSLDVPRAWAFVPLATGFALVATEFLRLCWRGESLLRPPAERETL